LHGLVGGSGAQLLNGGWSLLCESRRSLCPSAYHNLEIS
jgi:hypothetical protein